MITKNISIWHIITAIAATLSSLTAEISQISRSRRLEEMEAAAVTAGVTVEGSALPRRVETTSDSVGRLNTLVNGGTGPGNGERSRGTATVVCIYVYSSTAQTNSW